ncbi:inverted formin-2 isoform X2 [Synchiropus splendidus]|uniref:inverted formin-2 isoform X2 n=1 Tax=Synchiropus splendidus TaxID=270530 RepID=UPI00237E25E6|nr:inverted formin-2 isoform X2 [Synchiropus splendidus]
MDSAGGETLTETAKKEVFTDNKSSGRGFKGHGRGGHISRGVMHGRRGMMMKGFGPPGPGMDPGMDGFMNGFVPPMRGMGRMRPYPDPRCRGRGGLMGMGPPPPPPPPPPHHHHHPRLPPPMHMRGGPFPPMPRPGLPPPLPPPFRGHPGFRGPPPHPRGRGMPPPGPPRHFHPMGPRGGAHSTVNLPGLKNTGLPSDLSPLPLAA